MNITAKMKYKYMVEIHGLYYQGAYNMPELMDEMEDGKDVMRFSRNKSDGKKFDTISAAAAIGGLIGGSRIVRYNMLNGDVEDVRELMKASVQREWKGATA